MVKQGYRQTEVGVIPEDWDCVTLLSKCNLLNGLTYSPNDITNNGLLVLRSSNVQNNQLCFLDNVYVNLTVDIEKLIQKDDIVICVRNGSSALIGKCAKASKDYNVTFGAFMAVLRGKNNDFIFQLLQQGTIQKHISRNSGATINQITNGDFKCILVPFPSDTSESKRIAEALSDVDSMISSLEKLIAKKKAVKNGAMQELLTGKKRLSRFSGEWINKKIEEIAEVGRGRVISHIEISKNLGGKYPVYSSQTTNNGIMGYLRTFDFDGDYITWTTDGVNAGTVFYRNGKFNCTNVCGTLKCKKDNADFVARRLGIETPKYVATNLANPKLMNDVMKKITITLPPTIEEQNAIATILSDMDNEIETLEQKLAKTRQLKQGMMQQLLTGKIRLV